MVDTGSYAAASRRLHLAQPAVWRKVQQLEAEFGVSLFSRAGRRVRPTAAGVELAARARRLLDAAELLGHAARGHASGALGVVRVSCAPPHVQVVLANATASARAAHPELQVVLRESSPTGGEQDVLRSLVEGGLDFAVGLPTSPATHSRLLYRATVVLPVAATHPLHGRRSVDVGWLRNEPLIVAPSGYLSRSLVEAACQRAGFAPLVAHESPYPQTMLALAGAGLGTPVLADDNLPVGSAPAPRLTSGRVPLSADAALHWSAGRPLSPAAAVFLEHVAAVSP